MWHKAELSQPRLLAERELHAAYHVAEAWLAGESCKDQHLDVQLGGLCRCPNKKGRYHSVVVVNGSATC